MTSSTTQLGVVQKVTPSSPPVYHQPDDLPGDAGWEVFTLDSHVIDCLTKLQSCSMVHHGAKTRLGPPKGC